MNLDKDRAAPSPQRDDGPGHHAAKRLGLYLVIGVTVAVILLVLAISVMR